MRVVNTFQYTKPLDILGHTHYKEQLSFLEDILRFFGH